MNGGLRIFWLIVVVSASAVSLAALAQSPLGLNPAPVEEPLTVQLWTDQLSYMEGDAAHVLFSLNRPAYVYVLDIRPDGKVRLLFPNGYSASNYVSPGMHSLPEGLYQFLVEPPAGTESLQILASLVPLSLPAPSPSDPYPLLGSDPNEALAIIQAQLGGIPESDVCLPQWATAWCSFTIVAKPQASTCACPPPTTYCPPVSSTPPLPYPPTVGYCPPVPYCPPTPPLPYPPPISYYPPAPYCPPTPPLPAPPIFYCPPVVTPPPCPPPSYNPCWPFFGFFFGFQISIGSGY